MSVIEVAEKIRLVGDPVLTKVSTPVEHFDTETMDVANVCQTTLRSYGNNAAAVAAPQVGYNKRLFVYNGGIVINPKIVEESTDQWMYAEGCLSIPDLYWYLNRPKTIRANYQDQSGNQVSRVLSEFEARVFQHEIDHLDGVLLLDRITKSERKRAIKKLAERGIKV